LIRKDPEGEVLAEKRNYRYSSPLHESLTKSIGGGEPEYSCTALDSKYLGPTEDLVVAVLRKKL
jgi:hypothetical protein